MLKYIRTTKGFCVFSINIMHNKFHESCDGGDPVTAGQTLFKFNNGKLTVTCMGASDTLKVTSDVINDSADMLDWLQSGEVQYFIDDQDRVILQSTTFGGETFYENIDCQGTIAVVGDTVAISHSNGSLNDKNSCVSLIKRWLVEYGGFNTAYVE